jgi:hypothetical protein
MRKPVSDLMLYAPKLSTRFEAQEIKETGNEEERCRGPEDRKALGTADIVRDGDLSTICVWSHWGRIILESSGDRSRRTRLVR